jgi:hypothetical protein
MGDKIGNNRFKITVMRESDKTQVSYTIGEDADISDWKYLYISMLSWVSFDLKIIKESLNNE